MMEETKENCTSGSEYMKMVHRFYKTMIDQKIMLVYEGEINQELTKVFTSLTERNLNGTEDSTTLKMRVFHVMVECLQNICKHSDDKVTGEPITPGAGIFMVGQAEKFYTITSGNTISNKKVANLKDMLENINGSSKDELKTMYKKQMREGRLSDKGGAGLGFIDIARKTGNPIEYYIEPVNEKSSFFIMKTTLDRK